TLVATVDNGLSIPVVVDVDRDGVIDAAYAGDMVGNLWKFDLSSASANNWKVAFGNAASPQPLLKVADSAGLAQPITSKPMVKFDPASGGVMVYVGTGQFFEVGDPGVKDVQSLYGVLDPCGKTTSCAKGGVTRANLVQQTITYEGTQTIGGRVSDIRILSKNTVSYTTKRGFYLDLVYGGIKTGERVISTGSVDWGDRVIFATLGLDGDVCSFGSYQWLMEIDPFTGGRTNFSVFDLNNDKNFDQDDYYNDGTTGTPVNGTKVPGGTGRFMKNRDDKHTPKKDGSIQVTANKPPSSEGRQSWRQIR
ncbi:MAG: pilus assembly protein, partial [Azovibrio sp.]